MTTMTDQHVDIVRVNAARKTATRAATISASHRSDLDPIVEMARLTGLRCTSVHTDEECVFDDEPIPLALANPLLNPS